jgi:hypothetical protein
MSHRAGSFINNKYSVTSRAVGRPVEIQAYGRVQTPWTSSNTAAPANTITDVAAAPVKKPTAQSSARSRN